MKKLVLIGAGGNGKVAADIAVAMGYTDITFLDDNWPEMEKCGVWQVVGSTEIVGNDPDAEHFCAVGSNKVRDALTSKFDLRNSPNLIHPSATVSPYVSIGNGTMIAAGAVVNVDTVIGSGVIINTGSTLDHDCRLGDFSHTSPGSHLGGDVAIGERSWVGVGASVKNGVEIGNDVIIGAGAALVSDALAAGTYVGVPAKLVIGSR